MSEKTDDSQDWPLRDWATRLRPPGGAGAEPPRADEPAPELPIESEAEAAAAIEASPVEASPVEVEEEPAAPEEAEPGATADELEDLTAVAVEEHAGGEFRVPDGYPVLEGAPAGRRRAVAVVVARFNAEISSALLQSALDELEEAGVSADAVLVMPVPGAFELPLAAMALAKTRRYACVVALGCVIRGETPHFDFVASEAASGLQLAAIETGVPVSFGLLTCETREQAEARVGKGAEAARAALEMADAFAQLRTAVAAP